MIEVAVPSMIDCFEQPHRTEDLVVPILVTNWFSVKLRRAKLSPAK